MALSYVDHGGAVATSTSAAPSYPATVLAEDVLIFYVSSNSSSIPTTLSGWTALGAVNTGGGMSDMSFIKIAAGGESGTVTLSSITGGTKGWADIIRARPSATGLTLTSGVSVGTDTDTSSTAFSVTGTSWTVATSDLIVCPSAILAPSGSYSANASGQTVAQAGGTVTSTSRFNARTGTNTIEYGVTTAAVTAGGTGAPSFTATSVGANGAGVARLIWLREESGAFTGTATLAATSTHSAAGIVGAIAAVALAATATLTAGGVVGTQTGSTLAATATTTAVGVVATSTGATSTGTANLTAAGAVAASTGASVPAVATITAAGVVNTTGATSGTYTVTITAAGTVTSGGSGTAALTPTATITAGGQVATSTGATLAATVSRTATGQVATATGATLNATATITAAGTVGGAWSDITVTGTIPPRARTGTIQARTKTATYAADRITGTPTARTKTATIDSPLWAGRITP